jgi:hypothetical protein
LTNANWDWLRILGRPKPGVRLNRPAPVQQTLINYHYDHPREFHKQINVRSAANGPCGTQDLRTATVDLAIVAGLVLLIAGSNVANLLVARAAARQRGWPCVVDRSRKPPSGATAVD